VLLVCDPGYFGRCARALKNVPPMPLESRHFAPTRLNPPLSRCSCSSKPCSLSPLLLVRSSSTNRRNPDLRQFSCGQSALQPNIPPDSWIRRGNRNIFSKHHITHWYYQDIETQAPCGTYLPPQEQAPVLTMNLYRRVQ